MSKFAEMQLRVLQAVRLKGRISEADLAASVDEHPAAVAATVGELSRAGLLAAGRILTISPQGRARLTELLAQERSGLDKAAIAAVYGNFRAVNTDLKVLVTDWQLNDGQPNSHTDAVYDAAVLDRLEAVHRRVVPIIAAAAVALPRLDAYLRKLSAALAKIRSGDTSWLTRPTIDSYHTVWFELHEELIAAAGLTREHEAEAGRA